MKKHIYLKKIMLFSLVHLFELIVLGVSISLFLAIFPAPYNYAVSVLFVLGYMIYLVASLIEDYNNYKGADFIV
jgi:uncharacterized membrane protein YczE